MANNKKDEYKKLKRKYFWLRLVMHIPNFIKLTLRLLRDRQVPLYLKIIGYGAFAYVLSPYDLLPAFLIPFFGIIEDIVIFIICMTLLVNLSPPKIVAKHVKAIDKEMKQRFNQFFYRR